MVKKCIIVSILALIACNQVDGMSYLRRFAKPAAIATVAAYSSYNFTNPVACKGKKVPILETLKKCHPVFPNSYEEGCGRYLDAALEEINDNDDSVILSDSWLKDHLDSDYVVALQKRGVTKDVSGNTLLHVCNDLETAKALIAAGADVNAKNILGKTPLHGVYNHEIAQLLITAGADARAEDRFGCTPLHEAITSEIAKALIAAGADVNAKNILGKTRLHGVYNHEIAKVLIAAGADVNAKDKDGCTPSQTNSKVIDLINWEYAQTPLDYALKIIRSWFN